MPPVTPVLFPVSARAKPKPPGLCYPDPHPHLALILPRPLPGLFLPDPFIVPSRIPAL